MTFRHSNELLLRIKANIVHDLMLHYGDLIYLKPCRNFEKVDNVQTKCNETKKDRTGLVVRASDSGSGDPGSILGRVGVLFP